MPINKAKNKKHYKLETVFSLNEFAEHCFVFKLKKKYPKMKQEEINKKIKEWKLERRFAPFGDGEGIVGDLSRFAPVK